MQNRWGVAGMIAGLVWLVLCGLAVDAAHPSPIPITQGPTTGATHGVSATGLVVETLPTLDAFAAMLNVNRPGVIAGVYVTNTLALRAVQQPLTNPAYVSAAMSTVTQFALAAQYGTIGLLAHNYLAGAQFANLTLGQDLQIIYTDGAMRRYVITSARRFQALAPDDPYSTFIDLDQGGAQLSSTELFNQVYTVSNRVVLQTCIAANGNLSWGRLFLIATPVP